MLKRIWSACALACALLLLSTTSLYAEPSLDDLSNLEVIQRRGSPLSGGMAPPIPTDGSGEPGDDDAPDRSGQLEGRKASPAAGDTEMRGRLQRSWSIENLAAGLRLHLLRILRTLR
ncbi:MAG: hypothetical protein ACE5G2_10500 [Candidatus Krumholzibacteriia bacterium]